MRKTWTQEEIDSEAKRIADAIGHFPTVAILKEMKRDDLSNQISRHGGFMATARRLGIDRPESCSDIGLRGEKRVASRLEDMGFEITAPEGVKSPFDMIVNGVVRIDVKSASFAEYGPCRGWFYRIGKYVQSDIVVLHQLDTQDDYVFYWDEVTCSQMTISRSGGKYAHCKNAWGKLEKLSRSMRDLRLVC